MKLLNELYQMTIKLLFICEKILNKKDVFFLITKLQWMMLKPKILFYIENSEIGVTHAVVKFKSDGNIQDVMSFLI